MVFYFVLLCALCVCSSNGLVYQLKDLVLYPHEAVWKASTFYNLDEAVYVSNDPRSEVVVDIYANSTNDFDINSLSVYIMKSDEKSDWKCYKDGGFSAPPEIVVEALEFDYQQNGVPFVTGHVQIATTGIFSVVLAYCPPVVESVDQSSPLVNLAGYIRMHNPHGYLPAESFSNLSFYGYATCLYGIMILTWMYFLFSSRNTNIYIVQKMILAALVASFCETYFKYMSMHHANEYGDWSTSLMVSVVLLSTVRATLVMVLTLFASLAYEVITPVIVTYKNRITAFAVVYFASYLLTISAFYFYFNSTLSLLGIFIELPLVYVNVHLVLWVYENINSVVMLNLQGMELRLMTAFKKLISVLFLLVTLCYPMIAYVLYMEHDRTYWEWSYLLKCVWDIIYLIFIASLTYIWSPRFLNTTVSYQPVPHVLDNEFGDDELADVVSTKVR